MVTPQAPVQPLLSSVSLNAPSRAPRPLWTRTSGGNVTDITSETERGAARPLRHFSSQKIIFPYSTARADALLSRPPGLQPLSPCKRARPVIFEHFSSFSMVIGLVIVSLGFS
eukprot:3551419-Pyramimonas_sp.AAC.1